VDTKIFPEKTLIMRERIENILFGILIGCLGAWQAISGMGLGKMNAFNMKDPGMLVSGLMFFFAGALSFFKGTTGPAGQDTPVYAWTNYIMILLILAGFGFTFFWTGIVARNFLILFLGLIIAVAVVWFAIARRPGIEKQ
jgi:hypothetical protein